VKAESRGSVYCAVEHIARIAGTVKGIRIVCWLRHCVTIFFFQFDNQVNSKHSSIAPCCWKQFTDTYTDRRGQRDNWKGKPYYCTCLQFVSGRERAFSVMLMQTAHVLKLIVLRSFSSSRSFQVKQKW